MSLRKLWLAIFIAIFLISNAVHSMDFSWVATKFCKNATFMEKFRPKVMSYCKGSASIFDVNKIFIPVPSDGLRSYGKNIPISTAIAFSALKNINNISKDKTVQWKLLLAAVISHG